MPVNTFSSTLRTCPSYVLFWLFLEVWVVGQPLPMYTNCLWLEILQWITFVHVDYTFSKLARRQLLMWRKLVSISASSAKISNCVTGLNYPRMLCNKWKIGFQTCCHICSSFVVNYRWRFQTVHPSAREMERLSIHETGQFASIVVSLFLLALHGCIHFIYVCTHFYPCHYIHIFLFLPIPFWRTCIQNVVFLLFKLPNKLVWSKPTSWKLWSENLIY